MNLTIATPLAALIEEHEVMHVRAEDASGAFGILPGHADFLTALAVSVLTWRDAHDGEHYLAMRGGMLSVEGGARILIATPEAVPGDDLHRLETEVLARFRGDLDAERAARTDAQRLHLAAIREIVRLLRPEQSARGPAGRALSAINVEGGV